MLADGSDALLENMGTHSSMFGTQFAIEAGSKTKMVRFIDKNMKIIQKVSFAWLLMRITGMIAILVIGSMLSFYYHSETATDSHKKHTRYTWLTWLEIIDRIFSLALGIMITIIIKVLMSSIKDLTK